MRLQHLAIYPLKGARAVDLTVSAVERRGLAHDRRWMIVDAHDRFVTQRTHPHLARLTATLHADGLTLAADGFEALPLAVPAPDGPRAAVDIWNSTVDAALADADAHAWLSAFVGQPVRLVYMDDRAVRPVNPNRAVHADDAVSFADGYPLLLTTLASLDDLNARIAAAGRDPVPMDRFRPNVVIDGTTAFAEDGWRQLRIGEVLFHLVKPCERCTVTTLDQHTGARGKEPLRTLATYRKVGDAVLFGQNLIPDAPGTIRLGDPVEVVG